jgi:hypothetical protein
MQFARRLFVAAVCTLGLFLASSAAQAQNTKLLPNDTEMIVSVNLAQILKSDVLQKNEIILNLAKGKIEEQLDDKGVSKWFKKADFDLFRDLASVTVAVPGGSRNPSDTFILLEGKFDADKIEAAAMEASKDAGDAFKVIKIGGAKVFEIAPKDEKTVYVSVLDKKTMVVCASKADVTEAIGRLKSGKKASFKADVLKSLLETVNSKQSINVVATSGIMTKLAENAPEGGGDKAKAALDALKTLDGFSAAVTVNKDIDFQLGVNAKDNDTASKYSLLGNMFLKGADSKLKDAAKKDERFAPAVDILKTLRISAQGSNLVVRGQITFDTLTEILKALPLPNNDQ